MQQQWPIALFVSIFFFVSCGNNQDTNAGHVGSDSTTNFYPFPQYLTDELAYIDSMPLAIERVVKIDGITTDSGYIAKDQFRLQMAPFLTIDPNEKSMKGKYSETSFHDLSLKAITFSISSTKPDLPLQQADILLNDETRQVKNVVIKMKVTAGDSTIDQRLLWHHHVKCLLAEMIQPANGAAYTRSTSYQWDVPLR